MLSVGKSGQVLVRTYVLQYVEFPKSLGGYVRSSEFRTLRTPKLDGKTDLTSTESRNTT
jgi:hypothetical protein